MSTAPPGEPSGTGDDAGPHASSSRAGDALAAERGRTEDRLNQQYAEGTQLRREIKELNAARAKHVENKVPQGDVEQQVSYSDVVTEQYDKKIAKLESQVSIADAQYAAERQTFDRFIAMQQVCSLAMCDRRNVVARQAAVEPPAKTRVIELDEDRIANLVARQVEQQMTDLRSELGRVALSSRSTWTQTRTEAWKAIKDQGLLSQALPLVDPKFLGTSGAWYDLAHGVYGSEAAVQTAIANRLSAINAEFSATTGLEWHDTSGTEVLPGRKPDLSCSPRSSAPRQYNVASIIELRQPTDDGFSDDALGELCDELQRVLVHQRWRRKVAGALFTPQAYLQMTCEVNSERELSAVRITPTMTRDVWQYLRAFMAQSSDAFGAGTQAVTVDATEYARTQFCGEGSCCAVYRVEQPEDAVLKMYKDAWRAREEHDALDTLGSISVGGNARPFPAVVAFEGVHLVVAPFARHFKPPNFRLVHAESLMKILKAVHATKLVHRDVRPANFFQSPDTEGQVLLNDWGCSAKAGVPVRYEGCSGRFQPPWLRHLNATAMYMPQAKDDLYSFVVSCYELFASHKRDTLPSAWPQNESDFASHDSVMATLRTVMV